MERTKKRPASSSFLFNITNTNFFKGRPHLTWSNLCWVGDEFGFLTLYRPAQEVTIQWLCDAWDRINEAQPIDSWTFSITAKFKREVLIVKCRILCISHFWFIFKFSCLWECQTWLVVTDKFQALLHFFLLGRLISHVGNSNYQMSWQLVNHLRKSQGCDNSMRQWGGA